MHHYWKKIQSQVLLHLFNWRCRPIEKIAPVQLSEKNEFAVLSMLCHRDLIQYLVAIKSFSRHAPPARVYILDDGSLTDRDKATLEGNIPGALLLNLSDYTSESCPRGGCWERLLAVAKLSEEQYVIQMDADTLTLGPIPEILEYVRSGRSFVLSAGSNFREFIPMTQRNTAAKKYYAEHQQEIGPSPHIQLLSELNFDKLSRFQALKYIRGCAGFSGFAKGSIEPGFIDQVSSEMVAALGNRWREWGSEQVMSNIVVSNSENAAVLPHPKYSNCNEMDEQRTHFAHFIGICRFTGTRYIRDALRVIRGLRAT